MTARPGHARTCAVGGAAARQVGSRSRHARHESSRCRALPRAAVRLLQRPQVTHPNAALEGVRAPVQRERFTHELPVDGAVPPELAGLYIRTGPNPQHPPRHGYHWCGL
jgi:hypothetical protein